MCGGMTLTSTVSYSSNGYQQLGGKVGYTIGDSLWTSVTFLDYILILLTVLSLDFPETCF